MKTLTLLLLPMLSIGALIPALGQTIYLPENITLEQIQQLPKKHVAWDIHEVLAQRNKLETAKVVFKNIPTLTSAIVRLGCGKLFRYENSMTQVYPTIAELRKNKNNSGQPYIAAFEKHGETKLARFIRDISNAYRQTEGIAEVVEAIEHHGHTQQIASNIGVSLLPELQERFTQLYPNPVLTRIKVGKVIAFANNSNNDEKTTSVYAKPTPQYFQNYNSTYGITPQNPVIFVDDSLANVQAAVKAGWVAIHWSAKKKIEQLIADLATLNVIG